jgi:hypothetical protein
VPSPALPLDSLDPANHSPADRARAVATILAAGLLRLRSPVVPAEEPARSPPEDLSNFLANQLAKLPDKSVTVTAG